MNLDNLEFLGGYARELEDGSTIGIWPPTSLTELEMFRYWPAQDERGEFAAGVTDSTVAAVVPNLRKARESMFATMDVEAANKFFNCSGLPPLETGELVQG